MPMPVFDTEADVPEAFRPEYAAAVDGKWKSKAEIELEVERGKHATLLDERRNEEKRRKEAEERADKAERENKARADGLSDEEIKRRQKEIDDAVAAERTNTATEREKREAAEKRADKALKSDRLRTLATTEAVGMMPDRLDDDEMEKLERWFGLSDKDTLVVLDGPNGKPTAQKPEEFLLGEYKKRKPWLFAFEGGSGGGTPGSTRGRSTPAPAAADTKAVKRSEIAGAL